MINVLNSIVLFYMFIAGYLIHDTEITINQI